MDHLAVSVQNTFKLQNLQTLYQIYWRRCSYNSTARSRWRRFLLVKLLLYTGDTTCITATTGPLQAGRSLYYRYSRLLYTKDARIIKATADPLHGGRSQYYWYNRLLYTGDTSITATAGPLHTFPILLV